MNNTMAETPNHDEQLKTIFDRLMSLYERHAQERQGLAKEKEEIVQLVNLLVSQTKEIGQYENGIRKRIQDCIKASAEAALHRIEQAVTEKSSEAIEQAIKQMEQLCQSMEKMMASHRHEHRFFSWSTLAVAILSGMLFGGGVTWLLTPSPILPLTSEQISYLHTGETLARMWPKLTQKEKDRLKVVSKKVFHETV